MSKLDAHASVEVPAGHEPLERSSLVRDLVRLGVPRGGLMMVHSSLSSIGHVEGGSETVVDALLEALGPDGTLVVPTFTDGIAMQPGFVFDRAHTPTQMGAIAEAARRRNRAVRSLHHWHSVAAIGPLAEAIAGTDVRSPWKADGPMPQVASRGGMFLLLGVPYLRLTLVHLCEFELGVPYRPLKTVELPTRRPDGSIAPLVNGECPPAGPHPGSDYNRLGQHMEDAGLVRVGEVGNAIARLVVGHDVRRTAGELYANDGDAFLRRGGQVTRLTRGHTLVAGKGDRCVVDPTKVYSTGP